MRCAKRGLICIQLTVLRKPWIAKCDELERKAWIIIIIIIIATVPSRAGAAVEDGAVPLLYSLLYSSHRRVRKIQAVAFVERVAPAFEIEVYIAPAQYWSSIIDVASRVQILLILPT